MSTQNKLSLINKRFFVTGAAGFIGFHLCKRLLDAGAFVWSCDNLTPYYDLQLKKDRLSLLKSEKFIFSEIDIADKKISTILNQAKPDQILHLAAQAGVRYSIENPQSYVDSNITGTLNLLEQIKNRDLVQFIYASSSSVYGANSSSPFKTTDRVDQPTSLYAVTKRTNELMAHVYSNLYPKIPLVGLRFFTVYGPWGRPDMAYWKFTKNILNNKPIDVYNHGQLLRDFTYIDDIIESIVRLIEKPEEKGHQIYNIGASQPVQLLEMIKTLEKILNKTALLEMKPMQPGDVLSTYADVSDLEKRIQFKPQISLEVGLKKFATWYVDYHKDKT